MKQGRVESIEVTNDGATILKSLGVDNPAAKVLVGMYGFLFLCICHFDNNLTWNKKENLIIACNFQIKVLSAIEIWIFLLTKKKKNNLNILKLF